jgi:NAD(P)H-hydrate epimerase
MVILSAEQIRKVDAYTIENEPIASIDLMERASEACVNEIGSVFNDVQSAAVFCGVGNNGGDGLVIARRLFQLGWNIRVFIVHFSESQSPDNKTNENRLNELNIPIHHIRKQGDLPETHEAFIIDALVGTGLTRPLDGLLLECVHHINNSPSITISIDLPSGLYSDSDNIGNDNKIIRAKWTLSFEVPKLSFMLPDCRKYTGDWSILDIGLDKSFINDLDTPYTLVERGQIRSILRERNAFDHKGVFGKALIVAGGTGKMGAAVLASKSCVRSGAGLVTAHIPEGGNTILQTAVPEVMTSLSNHQDEISGSIEVDGISAIGVGPGIGTSARTERVLSDLLSSNTPIVLDADALNIISGRKQLLDILPKNAILTPHVKEFERLFGEQKSAYSRLMTQIKMSKKYSIYIVLKGKYSSITAPDGSVFFNSTGNVGMATGGSGDVLTGILTGLLAQGYSPQESCVFGCYLHGLAGDIARDHHSEQSMIASDIINALGEAYSSI